MGLAELRAKDTTDGRRQSSQAASIAALRDRASGRRVDPLPGLQRWIARLGDAHARVRATDPVGHLPYTARVLDRAVRFMHVPADSPAARAGVRTGDALLDVEELWARTGALEHLRPWLRRGSTRR